MEDIVGGSEHDRGGSVVAIGHCLRKTTKGGVDAPPKRKHVRTW